MNEIIEDLKDWWKYSDFLEKLMYSTIVILIGLVLWLFVILYNHYTGISQGYVYEKKYIGSYTTYIYVNNTMIPQYHGESYNIKISEDKYEVVNPNYCEIPSVYYKDIKIGQFVDCNNLDN
jgi:hypothetical protein